ncbi:LytTR family DNA-binding domain-containing protein [Conexibacter sp. SYSU D00693]|uniref:LytR/AlgR family response regulator transcription factor n=1 Tax=Conexibacter sp. SYSU D00693 TaxID=2812560 RepID=UPI00196AEB4A|nr:LytTR family DNA-binding domain-containing protein [Conexibacter sp. SYSU D00693]
MSVDGAARSLRILAVDDEPRALLDVRRQLERSPLVASVETATGARDALVKLSGARYDGLFLDVQMPEIKGMALARLLRRFTEPPAVVFLTGHPSAAVEAFEVEAVDFLVKPVGRDRLQTALERVHAHARARRPQAAPAEAAAPAPAGVEEPARGTGGPDVVAVDAPRGGAKRLVRLDAITTVQANGDYARIACDDGRYLLRVPLTTLESEWEPAGFARVHRGWLVNLRRAVELRGEVNGTAVLALDDGTEVPVARRHVAALRRRLQV